MDHTYVSRSRTNFDRQSPTNRTINGYGVTNISFGMELPTRVPTEITLFARNLFNSRGRIAAFAGDVVAPERYTTVRPRTVGVSVQASY